MTLHTVRYRDGDRDRSVAHRMSFAEMVVPYRDSVASITTAAPHSTSASGASAS